MSLDNPFAQAEAWEVSTDELMDVGVHVATIVEAEDATAESSGNPQVIVRLQNAAGQTIREWVAYHEQFLGKIVAVYDKAGLERPKAGEFNPEDHCRLTEKKIHQLTNQKVGVVVHDEQDNRPGKTGTRRRVRGFVTVQEAQEAGADAPIDTRGLGNGSGKKKSDDDLPF